MNRIVVVLAVAVFLAGCVVVPGHGPHRGPGYAHPHHGGPWHPPGHRHRH